eukprot:CAMPEP_0116132628 /NCGR_PEP_ID=MMETSP0329-20121206/9655_1 /TAXON_ID=697910 /ORGANISM="Pseudo-nitzschia arenysensis, Strain B593" /LENGTH=403 /DNA_ID=CAMNT_0003627167 /DNA_START=174 /DNA_END=1385 /DNA_ORIENTATION=-
MTSSSTTIYQDKPSPTAGTARSIEMSGELSLSSQHSNHKNVELSGELSFLDNGAVSSNHSVHSWSHKGQDPKSSEFSVASNRSTRTWGGSMLGAIEKFNEKSGELSIRSNRTWTFGGNNNASKRHQNNNNSNRSHRTNTSAASNRSNRTTSMEQQELYYDDVSLLDTNTAASNRSNRSMDKASNRSSRTASIRNRTMETASPGSSDKSLGRTETSNFSVSHFYGNGVTVSGGPPDENFIDEFGNSCSRYVNRTIVINDHMANYAASRSIQGGDSEDGNDNNSKRPRNSLSFRYKATLFFFVASTLFLLLLLILDVGKSDLQVSNTSTTSTSTTSNTSITSNKNNGKVFEGNNEDYYHHISGAVENGADDNFFDEFAQDYSNEKNQENAEEFETKTARLFEGND